MAEQFSEIEFEGNLQGRAEDRAPAEVARREGEKSTSASGGLSRVGRGDDIGIDASLAGASAQRACAHPKLEHGIHDPPSLRSDKPDERPEVQRRQRRASARSSSQPDIATRSYTIIITNMAAKNEMGAHRGSGSVEEFLAQKRGAVGGWGAEIGVGSSKRGAEKPEESRQRLGLPARAKCFPAGYPEGGRGRN
ncbi:hypothetical protein KM043_006241 [Ampulex compressa]|nr:hypothetical protein KM043_006241 [Ampulex compressa]